MNNTNIETNNFSAILSIHIFEIFNYPQVFMFIVSFHLHCSPGEKNNFYYSRNTDKEYEAQKNHDVLFFLKPGMSLCRDQTLASQ